MFAQDEKSANPSSAMFGDLGCCIAFFVYIYTVLNAKFLPFLTFAVSRCSSMSRRTRYRSHLRFPESDPFPEYGGVEPENEEGGVDPYAVRVRQALLDMRSPAQVMRHTENSCLYE